MDFNPIQLAYGCMIIGIIFCFVLAKQQKKDIRKECDGFALSFVKLSNFISPVPPREELAVEEMESGMIKALEEEQQPDEIRQMIRRANDEESVSLFAQMAETADKITKAAGINRTRKEQFADPINQILLITHTFLTGCENLSLIDTQEKKKAFDSFLKDQVEHRMTLLSRISGSLAEEYRSLNRNYEKEMKKIEQEQWKKNKNRD
ncbi:hypothetical protein AALB16_07135 [Lachnospiraceae bacterium 62-35]